MSGLRYEVHRMPPGMQQKVVSQVLAKISAGADQSDADRPEEQENPCMSCLRWEECMGVDGDCPHRQKGMLMPW